LIMSTMKGEKGPKSPQKSNAAPEEVFDLIHRIMHLFRSQQYRALRGGPHEMTHLEGKLLGFLSAHPGATLSDLVAHFGRDKGQMARLVKSLKDQGMVGPGGAEKKDRRSTPLELTGAGLAVHQTLRRRCGHLATQSVKGLDEAECRRLLSLLQKVRANLEEPL